MLRFLSEFLTFKDSENIKPIQDEVIKYSMSARYNTQKRNLIRNLKDGLEKLPNHQNSILFSIDNPSNLMTRMNCLGAYMLLEIIHYLVNKMR